MRNTKPKKSSSKLQAVFSDHDLAENTVIELARSQSLHIIKSLRMRVGDRLVVFNGRDGAFHGIINSIGRKDECQLLLEKLYKHQPRLPDISVFFAPIKAPRMDYFIQKMTEMGARNLFPLRTEYCVVHHLNEEKLRTYCVNAAEQCHQYAPPVIKPMFSFSQAISSLDKDFHLFFCDETLANQPDGAAPIPQTSVLNTLKLNQPKRPLALAIGPEGGFSNQERLAFENLSQVTKLRLGPRILRADTAAVAGLALLQATFGDWN